MGFVLPSVHHFMSRLRELLRRSANRRTISLNASVVADLNLMLFFLDEAKAGVDMNILSYRKPTKVYRSDSCPAGLGGYSSDGFAWRFYIPLWLKFRASNNLMAHLSTAMTPWIDIIARRLGPGDRSLSMTDSSTSEGWLRKTNFNEDGESPIQATIRLEVSRGDAKRMLKNKVKNYSQWFPGRMNEVSDALSWDNDRSDEELTHIFRLHTPSQIPSHFKIVPLPKEISSWLILLLQRLPVKEQLQERHTRTKLGRGQDGKSTPSQLGSTTTSSSTTSPAANGPDSWKPLPWLSAKGGFQDSLMTPWLRAQSEVPFHTYHRLSGRTIEKKPTYDKDGNLGRISSRQFRAFKKSDPSPKQQKAIPICIVEEVFKKRATETQQATEKLGISASLHPKNWPHGWPHQGLAKL